MSGPLGFDDEPGRAPERTRPAEPAARTEPAPQEPARPAGDRGPREPIRELIQAPVSSRYGRIVGIIAILLLLYIGLNTLKNHGAGPGSKGPTVGTQARAFAAPLATGSLRGAVDVATKPGQGSAGKVPACQLHLPGAFNVCDLWNRGPVAVVFFAEPVGGCVRQLDTVQQVARRHPRVGVVAVAIRGNRGKVAALVRDRGLAYPVVYDEDGRLANLYSVAVCPQITYLRRGGIVAGTNIGTLSAPELETQLRALEAGRRIVVE